MKKRFKFNWIVILVGILFVVTTAVDIITAYNFGDPDKEINLIFRLTHSWATTFILGTAVTITFIIFSGVYYTRIYWALYFSFLHIGGTFSNVTKGLSIIGLISLFIISIISAFYLSKIIANWEKNNEKSAKRKA